MRVLIDECLPRRLARALVGLEAMTVPEAGWAGKSNGELLALAEAGFDVFVTIDRNMTYQQNLAERRMAIVVLVAPSNRFDALAVLIPEILQVLGTIAPGDLVRIGR